MGLAEHRHLQSIAQCIHRTLLLTCGSPPRNGGRTWPRTPPPEASPAPGRLWRPRPPSWRCGGHLPAELARGRGDRRVRLSGSGPAPGCDGGGARRHGRHHGDAVVIAAVHGAAAGQAAPAADGEKVRPLLRVRPWRPWPCSASGAWSGRTASSSPAASATSPVRPPWRRTGPRQPCQGEEEPEGGAGLPAVQLRQAAARLPQGREAPPGGVDVLGRGQIGEAARCPCWRGTQRSCSPPPWRAGATWT